MADEIRIDAHELSELGADLTRVGQGLIVDLGESTGVAAKGIARTAQGIARGYPSTSMERTGGAEGVANSIRALPRGRGVWVVEAGGEDSPLAGLWELGNKNSDPDDPTFRHPVFGRKDFQDQKKWPYLRMALNEYEPTFISAVGRVIDKVFGRFRF